MKKEEEIILDKIKSNLHNIPGSIRNEVRQLIKLVFIKDSQLSETEEKLKGVYVKVLEDIYYDYTCPEYGGVTELCRYCEEEKGHKHDTDCIVLEAQTWLEDKE